MRQPQSAKPGRGRPAMDPVDRIRAAAWYTAVKTQSGLSDYALDMRFARQGPGAQGALRNRVFERIRKTGQMPRRPMTQKAPGDLIDAVNAAYPGTADIFESPLWDMLKSDASDLRTAHVFVSGFLGWNGLSRHARNGRSKRNAARGMRSLPTLDAYRTAIRRVLKTLPAGLDQIGLVIALQREAAAVGDFALSTFLQGLASQTVVGARRAPRSGPVVTLVGNAVLGLGLQWPMLTEELSDIYDEHPAFVIRRPLALAGPGS